MLGRAQIPGIEVEAELGHGAYSVVYLARQGSTRCALKLPRSKGRWTRWIYREAVALARVRHAGLPEVIEVGELEGLPYLLMELVEGETLAERLHRGALREAEVFDLVMQLVPTLGAVHDAGLVHRDVKPRNILIGETGRVRLVDFGFATPMERTGIRPDAAGTPGYAAPEQLRTPTRIDARADLYAVGRVLLECLTGRLPALAEHAHAAHEGTDLGEVCQNRALEKIVLGLLAEDPAERYPDVTALMSDLGRARDGQTARGPTSYEPARRAAPFVGRDTERQRLLRICSNVGEGGGSVVLVQGMRGSGKTRLLAAAIAKVRDEGLGRAIEAQCREADPPLAALRRILEAYLASIRRLPGPERAAGEDALRAAAAGDLASFATLIAPVLAEVLGPSVSAPAGASGAFPEGAAELFVRLARLAGPLFLSVDDLQWADPMSREVLVRLAHRIREAPLVLILSSRADAISASAAERFLELEPSRFTKLLLAPMQEPQIATLIAAHLGSAEAAPALVRRIAALADGTPLGVLEVLGAFLDAGALRTQERAWKLDVARAERITLPEGALALLGRRIGELPPATLRVLEVAALLGTAFDEELLAGVVDLSSGDLDYALSDARHTGLVEAAEQGRHRFVHDSLREMLVLTLTEGERRTIHQRIAAVLEQRGDTGLDALCATALHYAEGEIEKSPERAYRAARAAAEATLERFDNETARRFFGLARTAAEAAGIDLDAAFYRSLGEAELRLGALDESLASFEAANRSASDESTRAVLFGRIAWVHQTRADPERAWIALQSAFDAAGERMPVESAASAAGTMVMLARKELRKISPPRAPSGEEERGRRELVCDLHYQNARLGLEYNKPLRLIQSTLQALEATRDLGVSRPQARARAMHGFVLTVIGRKEAGSRELAVARQMASDLGDPVARAFCVQLRSLAACFAGDFDGALVHLRECLGENAPWLELNECCHDAANGDLIEALRGRPTAAWAWIERAIDRVRRSRHVPAVFEQLLIHRARATLASLGRDHDVEPWLLAQLEISSKRPSPGHGFLGLLSWGARARSFVESGDLGPAFEALVEVFEAEKHNPRFVHPVVCEYYIAIAHARLHQAVRAPLDARAERLRPLRKALGDLRAAARIPLFKAHRVLIEGSLAWLEGSPDKARPLLAQAEALAETESCPWVLCGVARARAHLLRTEGKLDAARSQACFAELLAREHGAIPRARWIREEFALPHPTSSSHASSRLPSSRSSSRARRQLASLLQVVGSRPAELGPEQQATAILDDLLRDVDAERGLLSFHPDPAAGAPLLLGRTRLAEAWLEMAGWRDTVLRHVQEQAEAWPPEGHESPAKELDRAIDRKRVLAVPLLLHDVPVGALCLERSPEAPPFAPEDREMLLLIAHQVPIALEMARLLAERAELQLSLQQAQKMEAVGQLAGGIAHDFNNMLAAIQGSLDLLRARVMLDSEATAEVELIAGAALRAAQLTRQLMTFSRHRPIPLIPQDVNPLLSALAPMLRRLVGERVVLVLALDTGLHPAKIDQASFEQAIVNLVVNARDAMVDGGTVTIETSNVVFDDATPARGGLPSGEYARITVTDTGPGIRPEVLDRIFEPFFTTKTLRGGTGLGLSTVYAFMKNCEGHVEASSELGRSSTFRLYFPKTEKRLTERPRPLTAPPPAAIRGSETLLVVDDEPSLAKSVKRLLEGKGYRVFVAHGPEEALAIAKEHGAEISLALLDVLMPGMSGPELGRRFREMELPARLLYMSGYAPEAVPGIDADRILEKPFSIADLFTRVRWLLDA